VDALITLSRVPRRPPRADVLLTALLFVWAALEALIATGPGPLWARLAFAAGVTLPLVVRRRAPVAVLASIIAVLLARVSLIPGQEESTFPFPSLLVATFSVALHVRSRGVAVGCGLAVVAAMLSLFPLGYYTGPVTVGQVFVLAFFVSGAWAAGRLVRLRAVQANAARDDSARLAAEAVTAERERIARELHDVVAHSLSIVAVQTGAAEELIAMNPELARQHVAAARRTAREALTEMRHVLDVRRTPDDAASLTPQPTLERVKELVDEVRAAGLPVTLTVEGVRGDVPAGIDLAGFRIVQEALTNVRRHAGAAETTVRVGYAARSIDVEVRNVAGPLSGRETSGSGRGLVGMRERIRLYGGTVSAAPQAGGFAVHARLPRESA
jgi:signal transduction histidine kinase